ncbi:class I SAM-dependent methyltransferase [Luteimonas yindakuii]|uniref:Class I SAM-dependent methyltransferase n=1 Tax=Luteimonas yindakuii TaxID=2565782 RepID=A0A4Z1RFD9_9GAMM|nr:class I SAM-dependent methyltransferase [Luteimonas yindakuii]TKS52799.1 class I SAM-dependent methyltransferase [Luteimonas yindakuii]
MAGQVGAGQHRAVIGGLWDEMGHLQLDFMRARGLQPSDCLLDLGCGSLRGGVHFVRYLDPGNYYGLDHNQSLLDAGYDTELAAAGLQDRLPRANLFCNADFSLPVEDGFFSAGIAQSVFSHLSFNSIRRCLETVAPKFRVGAILFATYFELPANQSASDDISHDPGGVVTHGHMDPYHYRPDDLSQAAVGAPWRVRNIGQWGHPRAQSMMAFERF